MHLPTSSLIILSSFLLISTAFASTEEFIGDFSVTSSECVDIKSAVSTTCPVQSILIEKVNDSALRVTEVTTSGSQVSVLATTRSFVPIPFDNSVNIIETKTATVPGQFRWNETIVNDYFGFQMDMGNASILLTRSSDGSVKLSHFSDYSLMSSSNRAFTRHFLLRKNN